LDLGIFRQSHRAVRGGRHRLRRQNHQETIAVGVLSELGDFVFFFFEWEKSTKQMGKSRTRLLFLMIFSEKTEWEVCIILF